ncbi:putative oxidoreductase [Podospora conica]|nr:putative oxidoreductase [Schizothecium conicum]
MPRVWHITGANSGLGLALALKALSSGDLVIAAVRNPSAAPPSLHVPGVHLLPFDLSHPQPAHDAHAAAALALHGRVDVLVNNAAYGYFGAVEELDDAHVQKQFDVNVFGVLRTIRAFLPAMRAQGAGTVMNISSVGGLKGFPGNGAYCATKFALEALTEALAGEVAAFGVEVVIVQPGYFRTGFLAKPASGVAGEFLAPANPAYEGTPAHEARKAFGLYDGKQPGNPEEGAARMWEYVAGTGMFEGKERLLRLPLGTDTGAVMRGLAAELEKTVAHYEEVWRSTDFKE